MFTIVVPAFNREALLSRCLHSVLAQQVSDWECIVIDDGSTDGTAAVAAEFAQRDLRFRVKSRQNGGAASARNSGIAMARGQWLCFLDSDDYYYPDALAAFVHAGAIAGAVAEPPSIVCGVMATDNADQRSTTSNLLRMTGDVRIVDAFASTYGVSRSAPIVFLQAAAFKRELVRRLGGFATAYASGEDREFVVRACAASRVANIRTLIACYTKAHGDGKSDRYLASGEKLAITQRMYADLGDDAVVRARFGVGMPERADYLRWTRCHAAMLATAEAMRLGAFDTAARTFTRLQGNCANRDEFLALIQRLVYFIYFPQNRPAAARAQCAGWFAGAAKALAAGPADLRSYVLGLAAQFEDSNPAH